MARVEAKAKPKTSIRERQKGDRLDGEAGRILLERGTCTARQSADRHMVSIKTVRDIWQGRLHRFPADKMRTLVMVLRSKSRWDPATERDKGLMKSFLKSSASWRVPLEAVVDLAAQHGIAVVFRGDLPAGPDPDDPHVPVGPDIMDKITSRGLHDPRPLR